MNGELKYHVREPQIVAERETIEAAKKNRKHFGVLYDRYYEPILKFVYQRVDVKETAFDISSQVFLKAMLNLGRYEFKGLPFSAWLYRIAINELNSHFRNNKNSRALNVEADQVADMISEIDENPGEEKIDALLVLVAKLPDDELHLIECRFFEKRSFKEIGQILDITENNAKVKTYRVLEKLKKSLTK